MAITDVYSPDFINKVNTLFKRNIITDEMIQDGVIEPSVPLSKLGFQIQLMHINRPMAPRINYVQKIITINNTGTIEEQRFLLAKALGMVIEHKVNA